MDLKRLKTFQVAAESLNLTKAAAQLGYTQPTITIQLQTLENELGYVLLGRVGKQTYLTPHGRIVKQYADQVFSTLQEMDDELRKLDQPGGSLTVAAPEFYCTHYLSLIMHSYISAYPEVKLQLSSYDSNDAMKKVHSREADLGIIAGPCSLPGIECVRLSKEDLVLVTTKERFKAMGREELLLSGPLISYKTGSNLQSLVNECLGEIGFRPSASIECVSDETIKRAVLHQTGIGLLGAGLVQSELKKGTLVELHRFPDKIETSMIVLRSRLDEINIRSFAGMLQESWAALETEG
ncbi:LysR family transcriptional regulator [Paenibacillus sp. S-38]|uniref:LysR family transcriptional regulator n=1 Tax=Paenibacillus sp. S-38 TaxID=3416710 RepID=UPI003CEA5A5C